MGSLDDKLKGHTRGACWNGWESPGRQQPANQDNDRRRVDLEVAVLSVSETEERKCSSPAPKLGVVWTLEGIQGISGEPSPVPLSMGS